MSCGYSTVRRTCHTNGGRHPRLTTRIVGRHPEEYAWLLHSWGTNFSNMAPSLYRNVRGNTCPTLRVGSTWLNYCGTASSKPWQTRCKRLRISMPTSPKRASIRMLRADSACHTGIHSCPETRWNSPRVHSMKVFGDYPRYWQQKMCLSSAQARQPLIRFQTLFINSSSQSRISCNKSKGRQSTGIKPMW